MLELLGFAQLIPAYHCIPELKQVLALARLRGLGPGSAWVLVMEFFGWRGFRNRREVGAAAGLVGTPYASGQSAYP